MQFPKVCSYIHEEKCGSSCFLWPQLGFYIYCDLNLQGNDGHIVKGLSRKNVDLFSSDSDLKFLR
jgi:hypothetical protein